MKWYDTAVIERGDQFSKFKDVYGFITPQPVGETKKPADNAVLYLSVASILGLLDDKFKGYYQWKVRQCYFETGINSGYIRGLVARWPHNNQDQCAWDDYLGIATACINSGYIRGLVARWPHNNQDQCAWDDYLGIATACLVLKEKSIPRDILLYGLRHCFVFKTASNQKGLKALANAWLGRHVHVWALMFAAAFPGLRYFNTCIIFLVGLFVSKKIDFANTSGFQLQWLFLLGASRAGVTAFNNDLIKHALALPQAFAIYYHKDHPFNQRAIS